MQWQQCKYHVKERNPFLMQPLAAGTFSKLSNVTVQFLICQSSDNPSLPCGFSMPIATYLCIGTRPCMQNATLSNPPYPTLIIVVKMNVNKLPSCRSSAVAFYLAIFNCLCLLFSSCYSCSFTVTNDCPYTIWPGTLAGSGTAQLPTTGFQLDSGQIVRIPSAPGWSGQIWARTGCNFDEFGMGTCQTGDCGGRLECDGSGATPPASLFEITLGRSSAPDDKDFYDVSFVDGYNLPLIAAPVGVYDAPSCNATGCVLDINRGCPKELQVVDGDEENGNEGGEVVACKSACEAFGLDQYCCSGEFANAATCRPSFYSDIFKRACPKAYSYAFDDATSTFTCKAYDYAIIFCPTTTATNSNGVRTSTVHVPPVIHSPRIREAAPLVSSPTIILPLQGSILLLILTLLLRK